MGLEFPLLIMDGRQIGIVEAGKGSLGLLTLGDD
jgi:hypothetical protein